MKYAFNFGKIEITGLAELQDINIQAEADIEETVTFMKQILPIVKEIKSFRLFEVEKDNEGLCKTLNETRDEKRETERELRQTKSAAELEKDRLQAKVQELEEKLREARMPQAMAQPAKKS